MARFRTSGVAHDGQPWVLVPSLVTFARQIEAFRPTPHSTDGTVAGVGHDQNNATSDHTVWPRTGSGRVYAIDVGDSEGTIGQVTEKLRASRDPRIMYVIHNRRIFSSYAVTGHAAWSWRPYSGYNAHLTHMHLSVQNSNTHSRLTRTQAEALADDQRPWDIGVAPPPPPGDDDMELVKQIQEALNLAGARDDEGKTLKVDGQWGPRTRQAFIRGLMLGPTSTGLTEAQVKSIINQAKVTV